MYIYSIPYDAHDGRWLLEDSDGKVRDFSTRKEAIAQAMADTHRVERATQERAYIYLQGADGHWRLFESNLTAPMDDSRWAVATNQLVVQHSPR